MRGNNGERIVDINLKKSPESTALDKEKIATVQGALAFDYVCDLTYINLNKLMERRRVFAECYEFHPDKDLIYRAILKTNQDIKNLLGL